MEDQSGAQVAHLLPFGDRYAISRLTYLRNRSLQNPQWKRDVDHLRRRITRNPVDQSLTWTSPSPLERELEAANTALDHYVAAARKADATEIDTAWEGVLVAVDILIETGNRLNGSRIKGRAI